MPNAIKPSDSNFRKRCCVFERAVPERNESRDHEGGAIPHRFIDPNSAKNDDSQFIGHAIEEANEGIEGGERRLGREYAPAAPLLWSAVLDGSIREMFFDMVRCAVRQIPAYHHLPIERHRPI
jgi:hypothetical protein